MLNFLGNDPEKCDTVRLHPLFFAHENRNQADYRNVFAVSNSNTAILQYLNTFQSFYPYGHLIKCIRLLYKALVRSHLDYCDIIYHVPSITHQPPLGMTLSSLMEKVERVQYQAALVITDAWQGSSRSKI